MAVAVARRPSPASLTQTMSLLRSALTTHNNDGEHSNKQHAGNNTDNDRCLHFLFLSPPSVDVWQYLNLWAESALQPSECETFLS